MLKKRKQHVEIFCFHKSQQNNVHCIIFLTNCFSAARIAKISLSSHCRLSQQPHCFACALQLPTFFFVVVWCTVKQADRNGETVKHLHNCIKVLSQFRTAYCTNRGGIVRGRSEAVRMTMHRYQIYNFRFQLLRQKIVSTYKIAAVSCNSHVQQNTLSSNRFTSVQGNTISWLSEFRVSFWHPKTA